MIPNSECLGCKLSNQRLPVHIVYENDYVCCFLDKEPFNEGHTLILPKKHFVDVEDLDSKTSNEIMKASKIISKALNKLFNPDGITICQNGGIFNDLTHYHMHVIPRFKAQRFYAYNDGQKDKTTEKVNFIETKTRLKDLIEELI